VSEGVRLDHACDEEDQETIRKWYCVNTRCGEAHVGASSEGQQSFLGVLQVMPVLFTLGLVGKSGLAWDGSLQADCGWWCQQYGQSKT
jgi:hypothetical protein